MQATIFKLLLATSLAFSASVPVIAAEPSINPLDGPATACWHAPSKSWYVSNMGGGVSFARDGNGWISRFNADGGLSSIGVIAGLDAPTGLVTNGTSLFVVDRTEIVEFTIGAYTVANRWAVPDAGLPNGAAIAKDGTLYVADTAKNRIYRITPGGTLETWVENAILEGPNALLVTKKSLIVGTWGPNMNPETFATSRPGTLMKIDLKTGAIKPYGKCPPIGNIDGLAKVEDDIFVTDWMGGRLLKVDDDGEVETVLTGLPLLASLGYSPSTETLMLPVMSTNSLVMLNLGALED